MGGLRGCSGRMYAPTNVLYGSWDLGFLSPGQSQRLRRKILFHFLFPTSQNHPQESGCCFLKQNWEQQQCVSGNKKEGMIKKNKRIYVLITEDGVRSEQIIAGIGRPVKKEIVSCFSSFISALFHNGFGLSSIQIMCIQVVLGINQQLRNVNYQP